VHLDELPAPGIERRRARLTEPVAANGIPRLFGSEQESETIPPSLLPLVRVKRAEISAALKSRINRNAGRLTDTDATSPSPEAFYVGMESVASRLPAFGNALYLERSSRMPSRQTGLPRYVATRTCSAARHPFTVSLFIRMPVYAGVYFCRRIHFPLITQTMTHHSSLAAVEISIRETIGVGNAATTSRLHYRIIVIIALVSLEARSMSERRTRILGHYYEANVRPM